MISSIEELKSTIESMSKVLVQRQQKLDMQELYEKDNKKKWHNARSQLETLEAYLNNQQREGSQSLSSLRNQQHFNQQLKDAIVQQRAVVDGKHQQYQLAKNQTVQCRLSCKQLEKLVDEYQAKIACLKDQNEQKVLDEIAGQLYRHQRFF